MAHDVDKHAMTRYRSITATRTVKTLWQSFQVSYTLQRAFALAMALCMLSLAGIPNYTAAEIYVIKNKDGSITYTSRKPATTANAQLFKPQSVAFSVYSIKPMRGLKLQKNHYNHHIESAARLRGVDANLIKAVIHAESGFNPEARSPKGALGLMQLMPDTARELGVTHPLKPADNVLGGTTYLASMIKRYDGDLKKALAAYNAGPFNVDKYRGIPPFAETQHYVRKVLELYKRYRTASSR
jgi:soluble lytic murein transglycosylase-like protein